MDLVQPAAAGNTAELYIYEDRIVKVFKEYLPHTEAAYEAGKQAYVHALGLPVPEIFALAKIGGRQAIIMEYVKGKTAGEQMAENEADTEQYLAICARIQQGIHETAADEGKLELIAVKLKRQIQSADQLDTEHKEKLLRKLESMVFKPMLCHGDFHPFNVIQSDEGWKVIDWPDASSGDRCADVCRTYLLFSSISPELGEAYVRIYCRITGVKEKDVYKWLPILAGARLSEQIPEAEKMQLLKWAGI